MLTGLELRPATAEDTQFLQEMLYQAANKPGEAWPPLYECVHDRRNLRFWVAWPRSGDLGVIAEIAGTPIGAAWIRAFREDERISRFDEPDIPELVIAVVAGYRGQRVGDRLLGRLLTAARDNAISSINLSTGTFNTAALRLYGRHGFEEVAHRADAIRMQWRRSTSGPMAGEA